MQTFDQIFAEMQEHGMKVPGEKFFIKIPDSGLVLENAFTYFLNIEHRSFQNLPEYDKVAEWLQNNEGRGLFMYGNCGRGKSLLARFIIPVIILKFYRKIIAVYDMKEVNANIDEVLKKKIISLDDIGTESESVKYGERRMAFSEIMDAAEKHGKLLILTTNLTQDEIKSRYGDRVLDRIISTTKRVAFNGKSLRK